MSAWRLWNGQVCAKLWFWFILKLVRINTTTTKKYHIVKKTNIGWIQPRYFSACNSVANAHSFGKKVFFFSHSWLVKKVKNVDLLLYISPFLFYNFVSCTCTLEVTFHSASFFLFRLCFKYNTISKTMPYVYFPHFRIRNIFSLVVITYTFGQQRQSTDWESGARRVADFLKHVWMINYLELLEESTSFKEHREKLPQNECFLSYWNNWNLIKRETRTFFCLVSRISTEKWRSILSSFNMVKCPSEFV